MIKDSSQTMKNKEIEAFSSNSHTMVAKIIIFLKNPTIRSYIIPVLLSIISFIGGAFTVAVNLNPRVVGVEMIQSDNELRISILEKNDIEQSVQLRMLVLYQIPPAQREELRKEAEQQVLNNISQ